MELKQLAVLVAIADRGSLSAAARHLGLQKSTVAKRLDQLEDSVETLLVERGPRAVHLTRDGAELATEARDILDRAHEIESTMLTRSRTVEGTVRLSVPSLLGQTILPPMFGRFAESNPRVTLDVTFEDRYIDLVEEDYDCAIRLGSGGDNTLIRRKLGESELVLVGSAALEGASDLLHPADLAHLPAIGFLREKDEIWSLSHEDKRYDLHPDRRIVLGSIPAIARCLASYPAIARLPRFIAEGSADLVHICPDWSGARHDISVVFPTRRLLSRRLRVLVDAMVEEFQSLPLRL